MRGVSVLRSTVLYYNTYSRNRLSTYLVYERTRPNRLSALKEYGNEVNCD